MASVRCQLAAILDSLPPTDRAALAARLAAPTHLVPNNVLAAELGVSDSGLRHHRKRRCSCPSDPPLVDDPDTFSTPVPVDARLSRAERTAGHPDVQGVIDGKVVGVPRMEWDAKKGRNVIEVDLPGHLMAEKMRDPYDPRSWDWLIKARGLDPTVVEIVTDTVRWRSWDALVKKRVPTGIDPDDGDPDAAFEEVTEPTPMHWFGAELRIRRESVDEDHRQIAAELFEQIRTDPPITDFAYTDGNATLVVFLSDWQIGQADGDGLAGQTARVRQIGRLVEHRLVELALLGRKIDRLLVLSGGDLYEGCDGFYAKQAASVQAYRRQQANVIRRALLGMLTRWAHLVPSIVVVAVAGNHGEYRKDGKAFTDDSDNDDLSVIEQVADALAMNPAYDHVKFVIPSDRLIITVRERGWVLGLTHGHVADRGGTGAEGKLTAWLKGQCLAREPFADADILHTGHLHSERKADLNGRMWIQAPALCDRSAHFAERYGLVSNPPGTTTYVLDDRGIHDYEILRDDTAYSLAGGVTYPEPAEINGSVDGDLSPVHVLRVTRGQVLEVA